MATTDPRVLGQGRRQKMVASESFEQLERQRGPEMATKVWQGGDVAMNALTAPGTFEANGSPQAAMDVLHDLARQIATGCTYTMNIEWLPVTDTIMGRDDAVPYINSGRKRVTVEWNEGFKSEEQAKQVMDTMLADQTPRVKTPGRKQAPKREKAQR